MPVILDCLTGLAGSRLLRPLDIFEDVVKDFPAGSRSYHRTAERLLKGRPIMNTFSGKVELVNGVLGVITKGTQDRPMRLTRISPQAAVTPEGNEVDLTPYINSFIVFEYTHAGGGWFYGVQNERPA